MIHTTTWYIKYSYIEAREVSVTVLLLSILFRLTLILVPDGLTYLKYFVHAVPLFLNLPIYLCYIKPFIIYLSCLYIRYMLLTIDLIKTVIVFGVGPGV